MEWEAVIGLEIHAQLATKSKIFSGASTKFGAEANSQACAIDLALPGTLPVFNQEALAMAVKFGLAIGAEIGKRSVFDRKNYFYPDLPKGYQTSQLFYPIVKQGELEIQLEDGTSKKIGVTRAHLEEDAGKSIHDNFTDMTGIDLNRAGTPLLEIVSEPDLRSPAEAVAYVRKIHSLVTSLGICDGNMAEGSFRCDCNVSIRPKGDTELGPRTETKNINSFRFIEKAIIGEIQRQIDIVEDGDSIQQETRLYDADKDKTRPMRSKEEANDYRYFPCPDLLPIVIDDDYIDTIRQQLPELPETIQKRFIENYQLSSTDAHILASDLKMAAYFECCARQSKAARLSSNWILGELARHLNQKDLHISQSPVSAEQLASLLVRIEDQSISGNIAKKVFSILWQEGGSADAIIEAQGLKQVTDTGAIEEIVVNVISEAEAQVQQYIAAEPEKRGKMIGFFMGKVMQATSGKANPKTVTEMLQKKLNEHC